VAADVEPRVCAEDVAAVLRRVIRPDDADGGESRSLMAERAGTSQRTIDRVLQVGAPSLTLDLADRLLVAAGGNLHECRLIWPDGTVEYP
jgi:hypothetical protein